MAGTHSVVTHDNRDTRLGSLLALFLVYRFCFFLPIPSVNSNQLDMMLSGVHSSNVAMIAREGSLLSLGLSSYLSAIYLLALASLVFPGIERMQKTCDAGSIKLGRWTVGLSFVIATYSSIRIVGILNESYLLMSVPNVEELFITALTLVAGQAFVLWLVGRLGGVGFGSGLGLIVFASTLAQLPRFVGTFIGYLEHGNASFPELVAPGILLFLIVVACVALWNLFQHDRAVIVCVALAGSMIAGRILTPLPASFEPEFLRLTGEELSIHNDFVATTEPLSAQQPLHYVFLFVLVVALWSLFHSSILRKKEDRLRSGSAEFFVGVVLAMLVTSSDLLLTGLDLRKFNASWDVPLVLSGYYRSGPGGAAFVISVFVCIEITNRFRNRAARSDSFWRRKKRMPDTLASKPFDSSNRAAPRNSGALPPTENLTEPPPSPPPPQ